MVHFIPRDRGRQGGVRRDLSPPGLTVNQSANPEGRGLPVSSDLPACYGTSAMASISMRAPFGRAATWTVERAGLWPPKAFS